MRHFSYSQSKYTMHLMWGYQPPHEAPARETRKGSTQAKNNKNIVVNHETFTRVKACHMIANVGNSLDAHPGSGSGYLNQALPEAGRSSIHVFCKSDSVCVYAK